MTISVVIPTLNEAARIAQTVESVFRTADSTQIGEIDEFDRAIDVWVVDGGSEDATCRLAREAGARVLSGTQHSRGRAHQLQQGAEESTGEVILFLHADTRLELGWRAAVNLALADPSCAGGAFAFRFEESGPFEKWIEWWVARRVAILNLPYGDQALFVRRSVLERIGGVPRVLLMEDLDLVRGIKNEGRLARLSLPVRTSSRRYREGGPLRTMMWHQLALLYWALGWDRSRLAARMGR